MKSLFASQVLGILWYHFKLACEERKHRQWLNLLSVHDTCLIKKKVLSSLT